MPLQTGSFHSKPLHADPTASCPIADGSQTASDFDQFNCQWFGYKGDPDDCYTDAAIQTDVFKRDVECFSIDPNTGAVTKADDPSSCKIGDPVYFMTDMTKPTIAANACAALGGKQPDGNCLFGDKATTDAGPMKATSSTDFECAGCTPICKSNTFAFGVGPWSAGTSM